MTLVEAREFIQALTEQFQVNEDLAIARNGQRNSRSTAKTVG
jgi:hypothetical protein